MPKIEVDLANDLFDIYEELAKKLGFPIEKYIALRLGFPPEGQPKEAESDDTLRLALEEMFRLLREHQKQSAGFTGVERMRAEVWSNAMLDTLKRGDSLKLAQELADDATRAFDVRFCPDDAGLPRD